LLKNQVGLLFHFNVHQFTFNLLFMTNKHHFNRKKETQAILTVLITTCQKFT